jgi:CheY-like chemotaxis protein
LRQEIPLDAERKVLLVEDEALVAALAVDALEELGYSTVEATTAKAAMGIVSGGTALLFAIVDVGLPDGRGDALAIELRKLRAELPIIIATGYDQAHLDERDRQDRGLGVIGSRYCSRNHPFFNGLMYQGRNCRGVLPRNRQTTGASPYKSPRLMKLSLRAPPYISLICHCPRNAEGLCGEWKVEANE